MSDWTKTRPWLKLNDKNEMICIWCMQTKKTNAFTNGNTNFRTSTLNRHCQCSDHVQAIKDMRLSEDFNKAATNAYHKKSEGVCCALESVYWLAKENIATLKFSSLMNFLEFEGVDIRGMQVGQNATYLSRASVEGFQEAIAEVIETDLCRKIQASRFISIFIDESTDISNSKKIVMYVRIQDPSTFIASTHFLGNIAVEGSLCIAEVLYNHVIRFLEKKDIPLSKLIGFGSDGASVMVGTKSGVATRLKEDSPHLINIHCMAHRFNLCTSQASKNIPYIKDTFEGAFKDLYYYFDKSANRVAELKELQKVLESPLLKIKEVHEIRWLAFYEALYAVYHSWVPMVKYFQKNSETKKCKELLEKITDLRFVSFLHIMMDVIPKLAQLNLLLQKSDLDIAAVFPAISAVLSTLDRAATTTTTHEPYYQRLLREKLKFSTRDGKEELQVSFSSVKLHIHRSTMKKARDDITKLRTDFIKSLTDQIQKRFPNSSTKVTTCFVFGLRNLSFLSEEESREYGDDEDLV